MRMYVYVYVHMHIFMYSTIEIEGAKPRRDEIIKWGTYLFV
jgi:hypothetical protein